MTLNPFPGHDPALPTVTRRSLLRVAPAATFGLLPCAALASAETPIVALYREHKALQTRIEASDDPDETERLCDLAIEVADRMAEQPAVTTADFAIKVLTLTALEGETEYPWVASVMRDCRAQLAGVL